MSRQTPGIYAICFLSCGLLLVLSIWAVALWHVRLDQRHLPQMPAGGYVAGEGPCQYPEDPYPKPDPSPAPLEPVEIACCDPPQPDKCDKCSPKADRCCHCCPCSDKFPASYCGNAREIFDIPAGADAMIWENGRPSWLFAGPEVFIPFDPAPEPTCACGQCDFLDCKNNCGCDRPGAVLESLNPPPEPQVCIGDLLESDPAKEPEAIEVPEPTCTAPVCDAPTVNRVEQCHPVRRWRLFRSGRRCR